MTFTVPTNEELTVVRSKAEQYRRERAVYKQTIKDGKVTVADFFDAIERRDPLVTNIRLKQYLMCLPGIGHVRADTICRGLGVAPNRKVGGLGRRQAHSLREYLQDREAKRTRTSG